MSRPRRTSKPYYIRDLAQMRAIISPARDEILDAVAANGPSTAAQLGQFLGRKPDSLYHHIRVLRDVGLLLEAFSPNAQGRSTAVYDVPGRPILLRYELGNRDKMRAVTAYAGSALRIAHRRFAKACKSDEAVVTGMTRNLWAARWRGWLTTTELREVNLLLRRLVALHGAGGSRGRGKAQLYDLAFVVSPALGGSKAAPVRPSQRGRRSVRR